MALTYDLVNGSNETRLAAYLALELQILTAGQAYNTQGTQFTRADLPVVRSAIKELQDALLASNYNGNMQRAGFGDRG